MHKVLHLRNSGIYLGQSLCYLLDMCSAECRQTVNGNKKAQAIDTTAMKPPSTWLAASEAWRAISEATTLIPSLSWLNRLPRGDGHPVYVLPGFMADDPSTVVLRRYLDRMGYEAFAWDLGRNLGPRGDLEARMVEKVVAIQRHFETPVSLIGQSLGGVFAREIAKQVPDAVRQVITLGSPFRHNTGLGDGTYPAVARLFEFSTGEDMASLRDRFSQISQPPPVPSTSIFSRSDGIASWMACLEPETPLTDNIEIVASHCGMGFNPLVYYIIANRLTQAADSWEKFDRKGLHGWVFPRPVYAA